MSTIEIDIDETIHSTEKAMLFRINDKQFWVPIALIHGISAGSHVEVYYKFSPDYIKIPQQDEIEDMFSDISQEDDIPQEPDFSDIIAKSKEKFPTPFD